MYDWTGLFRNSQSFRLGNKWVPIRSQYGKILIFPFFSSTSTVPFVTVFISQMIRKWAELNEKPVCFPSIIQQNSPWWGTYQNRCVLCFLRGLVFSGLYSIVTGRCSQRPVRDWWFKHKLPRVCSFNNTWLFLCSYITGNKNHTLTEQNDSLVCRLFYILLFHLYLSLFKSLSHHGVISVTIDVND